MENNNKKTVILGAGPAGLAAAYELVKNGSKVVVIEKNNLFGGISRTVEHKGYHFDVGGHRFFTKEEEVQKLWNEVLGDDFLKRPRLSRIYYNNKFFNYPLKPTNALKNLGLLKSISIFFSYLITRIQVKLGLLKKHKTFEDWVTQKFGHKLFNIFFKTYTEKVWGIPTSEIGAEWAAQRIKGLSLSKAVINAFFPKKKKLTTLIDEFNYPLKGPGMMWRRFQEVIEDRGGRIQLDSEVIGLDHESGIIVSVTYRNNQKMVKVPVEHVISTMSRGDV